MDNNIDNEMKDFEEQIANNMRYDLKDKNTRRHRVKRNDSSRKKIMILGGFGVLILIVLIAIFFGGDDKPSKKDQTPFEVRLDQIEKRLTRFEGIEIRVASLENKGRELEQAITEADNAKRLLNQQYNKLAQRLETFQKEKTIIPAKTTAPITTQKTPSSLSEERFHKVRSGDTLYRIAQKYRISLDELCRLNNITSKQAIYPGQKLLVTPESAQ
jgi:LysM repeat protein